MEALMDKRLFVFSFLMIMSVIKPQEAHAWFFNFGWGDHQARYRDVVVGGDRYYYNGGVFYTGGPGNYVAVEAPEGAVIYDAPPDYQQVQIDGGSYFLSHGVYYQRDGRGYRVIRPRHINHDEGRHEGQHHEDRDGEHHEDRQ
jgi:hypothetical protein